MKRGSEKLALVMLSTLFVISLASSLMVTPARAADYTKVGVKVGDWAHYSYNETYLTGFNNMNLTVTSIYENNVTMKVPIYSSTIILPYEAWINVSTGVIGGNFTAIPYYELLLIAPNLAKGDLLGTANFLYINGTRTMMIGGLTRVCNHLSISYSTSSGSIQIYDYFDEYWDQLTGINVYYNNTINEIVSGTSTRLWTRWSLISTSLWSPPPTINHPANITYTYSTTGHSITWNASSYVPKNYTVTRDGTQVAFGTWNGQAITQSVDGLAVGNYLYNCTVYDIFSQSNSSTVKVTVNAPPPPTINQPSNITYTYSTTGHSITWTPSSIIPKNYTIAINGGFPTLYSWNGSKIVYNVDGLQIGSYLYNCTVYDTLGQHAGSIVKVNVTTPTITINQPANVTYTWTTTGHSITWTPSSIIPKNYTITVGGGSPASHSWNGSAVICNVDGLAIGSYTYTCTVYDTLGQHASSTVKVTVTTPTLTINKPANVAYTWTTTGHSITWSPSSILPKSYTVTRNGTTVVGNTTWNGQAIVCNVDGLRIGGYSYNCTVYDTLGQHNSSVVTVTVSTPAAPTISQPAAITYVFGATGHSITWSPSSLVPSNYIITRNGTEVASGTWNGQVITCDVDGLQAGTYVYNCTVYDSLDRYTSSAVTVTVSASAVPLPVMVPLNMETLVIIALIIVFVAYAVTAIVMRRRKRAETGKQYWSETPTSSPSELG